MHRHGPGRFASKASVKVVGGVTAGERVWWRNRGSGTPAPTAACGLFRMLRAEHRGHLNLHYRQARAGQPGQPSVRLLPPARQVGQTRRTPR